MGSEKELNQKQVLVCETGRMKLSLMEMATPVLCLEKIISQCLETERFHISKKIPISCHFRKMERFATIGPTFYLDSVS